MDTLQAETVAGKADEQIHTTATASFTFSMFCSVIRLVIIMTKTNTVKLLINLFQRTDNPKWECHKFLEVWCCIVLIPVIFSPVSSSAGIEPSGWEGMGWITFLRARVVLRYSKTSMETKWGFNWADCWCLRSLQFTVWCSYWRSWLCPAHYRVSVALWICP